MTELVKLTDRQSRMYRALTDAWELAYDIAQRAEVDNRGAGQVLKSLERLGLAEHRFYSLGGPNLWRRIG